jgi:hypothetical protein
MIPHPDLFLNQFLFFLPILHNPSERGDLVPQAV